jgi:hypothetical protein
MSRDALMPAMAIVALIAITACASSNPVPQDAAADRAPEQRDMWSGEVGSDPAMQRAREHGLGALEARCREAGEFCAQAEAVRRGLEGE